MKLALPMVPQKDETNSTRLFFSKQSVSEQAILFLEKTLFMHLCDFNLEGNVNSACKASEIY